MSKFVNWRQKLLPPYALIFNSTHNDNVAGKRLSSLRHSRPFSQSIMGVPDDDEDDDDDLGGTASIAGDPAAAFADLSFRAVSRENVIRKTCICLVLNP